MGLQNIVFGQFLEEEETISQGFRQKFPFGKLLLWSVIIFGGVIFLRWFFFCSHKQAYCPLGAETMYLFIAGGAFWFYKMFQLWIRWYGNGVFMTSESLLFVYWENFFAPRSARLDYWDLDEIEIVRKGFRSYLGRYADVHFNKISGGKPIIIERVYRPHRMEQIISKNKEIMTNERNFTEETALKDLLSSLAIRHVETNGQPQRTKEVILEDSLNKPAHTELKETEKAWIQQTQQAKDIKIEPKHHFKNEIIYVEKKLDDDGGIEIDL